LRRFEATTESNSGQKVSDELDDNDVYAQRRKNRDLGDGILMRRILDRLDEDESSSE